jgi:hypothetical protein
MTRVQGHRDALETIRALQKESLFTVALPQPVDSNFCTRDDWGRSNRVDGISIGVYQHENNTFQPAHQHVWILHVEMTLKERPKATPTAPSRFTVFAEHA